MLPQLFNPICAITRKRIICTKNGIREKKNLKMGYSTYISHQNTFSAAGTKAKYYRFDNYF